MAKQKTVEITLYNDSELFAIYRRMHVSWLPTYISKQVIYNAGSCDSEVVYSIMDGSFDTIKQIETYASIYGLTVKKSQQLSMFHPYALTGTDRAKRFIEKQKNRKKKRLSVWLNKETIDKLDEIKQKLHALGLIDKPTQAQAIAYILNIHPKVPF